MGNYAVVLNGKVINLVVWDGVSDWRPADDAQVILAPADISFGWSYDQITGVFAAPPVPPAPSSSGAQKLI